MLHSVKTSFGRIIGAGCSNPNAGSTWTKWILSRETLAMDHTTCAGSISSWNTFTNVHTSE